jgi:hypothetical protein
MYLSSAEAGRAFADPPAVNLSKHNLFPQQSPHGAWPFMAVTVHVHIPRFGEEHVMASKVDHNAIKFNQVSLTLIAVVAYLANASWLVGILALILAAGTVSAQWGLFRILYQRVALPLGVIRPHIVDDDPTPHRFAQGVGAAFLILSWLALVSGQPVLGWVLDLLVAVLAMANVVLNFCAGCFVHYQLRRAGLIRGATVTP